MKKIPSMFLRDPENMSELTRTENPVCDWVFRGEGKPTRKYDGTCCLIKDGKLFKRREVKKGKDDPLDFVFADHDKITGKRMGWVPVTNSKEDQRHMEAFNSLSERENGTYELVGPKVQGNPENTHDHILLKHSYAENYTDVPRDFDGIKNWLSDMDIEGVVFHHPDGRMSKIKKSDFKMKRL